jgi:hypothetical protein
MPRSYSNNFSYDDLYLRFLGTNTADIPDRFWFNDHFGGYDRDLYNPVLRSIDDLAAKRHSYFEFLHHQILDDRIRKKYPSIKFHYSPQMMYDTLLRHFENYHVHPEIKFQNFVCSFNGSPHVSRKLLAAVLHRFEWFDPDYCSKNFCHDVDAIDGHLADYVGPDEHQFYRKFFIGDRSSEFFDKIYSFGHDQYRHSSNIYRLEHLLTKSFLHIVSETVATSYYPHVTEKFLYSVITRGLFVAYAQPGWHEHLSRCYGFRQYQKIFDYRFDSISNPIERLVEMMCMIAKFSVLSSDDWRDLYEMERDTIEYNYDHYFSGQYLRQLESHG